MNTSSTLGQLLLMPNTLDLGREDATAQELRTVIPDAVLQQASQTLHWVAEHPRTTRAFLRRLSTLHPLVRPLQEMDVQPLPRPGKGGAQRPIEPQVWEALLAPTRAGADVALQSEAGLPGVADPGAALVAAAHRLGVPVQPLAGPSSLMMALSASGLDGQSFAFVGYVPVDAAQRSRQLKQLEQRAVQQGQTQILIETPYRNPALWDALLQALSADTGLCVACGLGWPGQIIRSATVAHWRRTPLALPADTPCVFLLGRLGPAGAPRGH